MTNLSKWNNSRIILLLALGGALLVVFVAIQILTPKTAMIPTRLFKGQRSVAFGLWSTACVGCSQYVYGKLSSSTTILFSYLHAQCTSFPSGSKPSRVRLRYNQVFDLFL